MVVRYRSHRAMQKPFPEKPALHNLTTTSTQGIRNCLFSITVRSTSNPLSLTLAINEPLVDFLLTVSNAALANEPPVPLIAEIAKLAVSPNSSVTVEFPVNNELAASVIRVVEGCHLGSNQSAWKSKSEKTRTKRSIEQYTQGRWSM